MHFLKTPLLSKNTFSKSPTKLTLSVLEKIFAHVLSTISQKKYFLQFTHKIAYTKMYRTQKLIN